MFIIVSVVWKMPKHDTKEHGNIAKKIIKNFKKIKKIYIKII